MQRTDAALVMARWCVEATPLSCVAALEPGPAVIEMPSCRLQLGDAPLLRSESGSVVLLSTLDEASEVEVETDWRGTRVEVTYDHGTVVIADY